MSTNPTFKSGGVDIDLEMFEPAGKPNGGIIVIAHGSDGMSKPWDTMIRGYGNDLAKLGFIAVIPRYFQKTKTLDENGSAELSPARRDEWQATLADGVAFSKTLPGVDASRVGLLGFSLGGHLVLRLRSLAKVLVEFFAPEFTPFDGLGSDKNPSLQVQIHHGEDDRVPFTAFPNAASIESILTHEGATVKVWPYKDAGHGFVGPFPGGPNLGGTIPGNAQATAEARGRTLQFFTDFL